MTANVIVCGTCGAATGLVLAVDSGANSAAKSAASDPQSAANEPQLAAVADIGLGSKDLKIKTYNPATGRKRFAYDDPDFAEFYEAYPLHREKAAAFAAWKEVLAAGVAAPQTLIAAAAKYADYCDRNDVDLRHRKYPAGWLRAGRWEDEYPEPKPDARYLPYDHEAHLRALEEI